MKKEKLTLTIGIPAHNEEANIKNLLCNLLNQKTSDFKLQEIIVYSDGSTDNTVKESMSVTSDKIKVLFSNKRHGKNTTQNKIFKLSNSDVLLILDADILPESNVFLNAMVEAFKVNHELALEASKVLPLTNGNLVSEVLAHSQRLKLSMSSKIAISKPVYICNGRAMAYSKKFYKEFSFPENILADDAYACLICIQNGYQVYYQEKVGVLYQVPSTVEDHFKQSVRFLKGKKQLVKIFGDTFINEQYDLPSGVLLQTVLNGLSSDFIKTFLYIAVLLFSKALFYFKKDGSHKWDVSLSSKKIIQKYDK